jgi:hypothetical protein
MMLNVNINYDWIMGEPVKLLITYKRQSPLMAKNTFVIAICMGRRFLAAAFCSPARTKRLLRRLVIYCHSGFGPTSYPGLFASVVGWSAKKALASAGLICNLIGQ